MLAPGTLTRVFLIIIAIMVLIGFVLQWDQSQRLKFLGIQVSEQRLGFEIANYGTSFVGQTDYVGAITFLTPREKSVTLFRGGLDLIPPAKSVTTSVRFDAPIIPSNFSGTETFVTQACLYTRGRLFFDWHFHKVYFRHSTNQSMRSAANDFPDLELAEYKHAFFTRPECNFVGSGNYFSYEINQANIDCQPIGDANEATCHTQGVVKSSLEGIFDPVQSTVEFNMPDRLSALPDVNLRN
jgi:hypothetical protein